MPTGGVSLSKTTGISRLSIQFYSLIQAVGLPSTSEATSPKRPGPLQVPGPFHPGDEGHSQSCQGNAEGISVAFRVSKPSDENSRGCFLLTGIVFAALVGLALIGLGADPIDDVASRIPTTSQ